MQRGVQYYFTLGSVLFPNFQSFYLNDNVDNFENDNFFQNAGNIGLNEIQLRSLHLVPDQNSNYSGCDIDWINFIAPCTGTFSFETYAVTGRTTVDTRITVFNNNLQQIAENDNISGSNNYSRVSLTLTGGELYRVRINNMSTSNAGFYNLIVGANLQISGPDLLCGSSQTYSIASPGTSVTWTSSNMNIATINPSTGLATPVQGASGTVTFTASVTICGQTFTQTKQVTVAQSGFVTGYYTMSVGATQRPLVDALYRSVMVGRGQTVGINFVVTSSTNVSARLWTHDNVTSTGVNFSTSITAPQQGYSSVTKTIYLDLTTPCGVVRNSYTFNVMSSGWSMRVLPNPANNVLSVSLDNPLLTANRSSTQPSAKTASAQTRLSLIDANSNLQLRTWLFKEAEQRNYQLNLSGIKPGTYLLRLERDGETVISKVIIQ